MTSASDAPFDRGLQTERTLLAWRRTSLALAAGNAAATHYLLDVLGGAAAILGVAGMALAAAGVVVATRRYWRAHAALTGGGPLASDGTLPLVATASVVVLGVAGLVLLLLPG